jgi:hypothetical protein
LPSLRYCGEPENFREDSGSTGHDLNLGLTDSELGAHAVAKPDDIDLLCLVITVLSVTRYDSAALE